MSLGSFLENVANGIEKVSRAEKAARRRSAPARRPPTPRPTVSPAQALGLDGSSPFKRAQQQARQRTQHAVEHLPNPPRLLQAPILKSYTPAQRDLILAQQGTRLHALAKATGLTGADLRAALPAADRPQLDLFARLAREREQALSHELGAVPRYRSYPGRAEGAVSSLWRGATIDLPTAVLGHDFQQPLAQIGDVGKAAGTLAKPTWKDASSLVVDTVPSLYQTGAAGVALAKGDTAPASRIAKGLADGFVGHLVRGDVKGAGRYFAAHPLFSALEVSGAEGAVGRTAGATMRTGVLGGAAKAAAAMDRAPLVDAYGRTVATRSYPPDVLRKGVVVAGERLRARRGVDPNRTTAARLLPSGQRHQSAARVDEFVAMAENLRRMGRQDAGRRAVAMIPTRATGRVARAIDRTLPTSPGRVLANVPVVAKMARPERDVVHAIVEGRVDPAHLARDLRAERNRLDGVYREQRTSMSAAVRQANRRQVRSIDRVLRDPRALANVRGLQAAADAYRAGADPITQQMTDLGLLDPEQAMHARMRPYAVAKMGARFDPRMSPPEHMAERYAQAQAIEKAAAGKVAATRAVERRAQVEVQAAQRDLASSRGHAGVAQGRAEILAGRADRVRGRAPTEKGRMPRRSLARLERERGRLLEREIRLQRARAKAVEAGRGRRAAEQEFRAARKQRERSKPKEYVTGLVNADGARVSAEDIRAHMDAAGVQLPSFVSHRPDTRGARAFFVNYLRGRQTADPHGRTGRATELGAHASDVTSLVEQHIHGQGVVDAVQAFDKFVGQFGLKRTDGSMFTWDEAQRLAQDPTSLGALDSHGNRAPGYADLVPVRVVPARYPEATRNAIAGRQDAHTLPDVTNLVEQRLLEAQRAPDTAATHARNVVLVPADELRRFGDHQLRDSTTAAKAGQALTGVFRSTVLPFSPKWLFGNTTEAALRLAVNAAGPNSYRIGRRVVQELQQLDEQAGREFRARTLGGTVFGGMERMAVHRDASSFVGTKLEVPAAAAGLAARAPVVKQAIGLLRLYQRGVFGVNKFLEQQSQVAAIGKEARQVMQETTGSWLEATRASEQAFADLLSGLTETPNQVRFARKLDEVLGKYSRFGPSERKVFQSWAPFAPWYLNSLRFVLLTLPAKHPVKTALLARVADTFQADFDAQRRALNIPPGDLRAGVVMRDGGILPLARFTPFGAFTNLPEGVADPVLPQVSSVLKALQGESWTGAQLRTDRGPATRGERIPIAINAFLESIVPGLSIARRMREHGATPYDNSTVFSPRTKPGSATGSALDRVLNPLRPTYLNGRGGGGISVPVVNVPAVSVPTVNIPTVGGP